MSRVTPKPLPPIPAYGDKAVEVKNLTFCYKSSDSGTSIISDYDNNLVLETLNLELTTGSRCLLIGANGSGKCSRSAQFCYPQKPYNKKEQSNPWQNTYLVVDREIDFTASVGRTAPDQ